MPKINPYAHKRDYQSGFHPYKPRDATHRLFRKPSHRLETSLTPQPFLNIPAVPTAAPKSPSKDHFPFLALPAEIRNQIYGLVFQHQELLISEYGVGKRCRRCAKGCNRGWSGRHKHLTWFPFTSKILDQPESSDGCKELRTLSWDLLPILLVSRQLYKESHGLLYGSCKFHFASPVARNKFIGTINHTAKLAIDSL